MVDIRYAVRCNLSQSHVDWRLAVCVCANNNTAATTKKHIHCTGPRIVLVQKYCVISVTLPRARAGDNCTKLSNMFGMNASTHARTHARWLDNALWGVCVCVCECDRYRINANYAQKFRRYVAVVPSPAHASYRIY